MTRSIRATCGVLALAASTAWADTYPRQPGITVTHYAFDFTLSDASDEIAVVEAVQLQFAAAGAGRVELDLCNFKAEPRSPQLASGFRDPCAEPTGRAGAAIKPTGGKGMTVTAVTAAGQPLTFTHADDRVRVTLPRAFQAGERLEISLSYHGVPATGILIAKNRHGDRGFFSDPWPDKARNYRATIDHPSVKATVTTTVIAPRHYQVISNGRLTEEVDLPGDLRRTVWKESTPICSWLMSLGAAPFAVDHFGEYRGIPLSSWTFPQERAAGVDAFAAHTQKILEFYIDRIGPYSYEKLAHVQANGIGGGMELASSIFYGYGAAGPGRQLIAHEMAHQWFGDSATEKDWDDVWLSEGFATYFALLYQEFADGRDGFLEGVRRSKDQAIRYAIANPESTIVHRNLADISKVIANNAQVYQGGAQVLQNVRGIVGTDQFWAGIRLYYARFQNRNATTDDFRRAMEEACAAARDRCPVEGRDLSWLFAQLLNRGGVLQVKGEWRYDAARKVVEIALAQTQTTGLYRMPIEAAITTAAPPGSGRGAAVPQTARAVHLMKLEQAQQVFTFPSETEPIKVELDPSAWVMMQATFEKR